MKTLKALAIMSAAMLSASCTAHKTRHPPAQNEIFSLAKNERSSLIRKALAGNGQSAYRLYLNSELVTNDPRQGRFWLLIASHSNHPEAMYAIGRSIYQKSNDSAEKKYALWLLSKAANSGVSEAVDYAKSINVDLADELSHHEPAEF